MLCHERMFEMEKSDKPPVDEYIMSKSSHVLMEMQNGKLICKMEECST